MNHANFKEIKIPVSPSIRYAIKSYSLFEALLADNECSADELMDNFESFGVDEITKWQSGHLIPTNTFLENIAKYFCEHPDYFTSRLGDNPAETHSDTQETKQTIYDEMCRVLTDYETPNSEEERTTADDLYRMLVKIQTRWEDTITAETN